jgi:MFS family permease
LSVALLRRNRRFARLWGARATSLLADSAAVVTLILYLTEVDGRATVVSLLLLSVGVPYLLSPVAGALADRVSHRRLMLSSEAGQGIVMVALAFLPDLHLMFALVFVRATLSMVFQPAGRSTVPALVDDVDLPSANGLMGAGGQASRVVGPALAGVLYGAVGPAFVLAATAGLSIITLLLLAGLPPGLESPRRPLRALVVETRAGLSYLRRSPPIKVTAAVLFASVSFAAMDDVALSFLGSDVLGAGQRGVGLLYSAPAVGLVLGGLAMGRLGLRLEPKASFIAGVVLQGAGLLAAAAAPTLGVAAGALILAGAGNAFENASADTLVHRAVPAEMLGRVFGNVYGAAYVASTLAYAVSGPLLDATSARWVFTVAGTGVLVVAGIGGRRLQHTSLRQP